MQRYVGLCRYITLAGKARGEDGQDDLELLQKLEDEEEAQDVSR